MKTLLYSSLLVLFALSLQNCKGKNAQELEPKTQSAETVSTVSDIIGSEVTYSDETTEMKGYIAHNSSSTDKRPGILVVHEWWGHNDYSRMRADMLADLGYVALAVDMYGDGKLAAHPEDAGKFAGMVMQNIPEAKLRFEAALAELKNHPKVDSDKIAAIGYCFGGSVVLSMANAGLDIDAVAAFHSGVALPIMPSEDLKAKVLVCNGADDPFISEESIASFKTKMDELEADYKYVSYEGVVHSFTSKEADENGKKFDLPLAYDEKADMASWDELQSLLNSVF